MKLLKLSKVPGSNHALVRMTREATTHVMPLVDPRPHICAKNEWPGVMPQPMVRASLSKHVVCMDSCCLHLHRLYKHTTYRFAMIVFIFACEVGWVLCDAETSHSLAPGFVGSQEKTQKGSDQKPPEMNGLRSV